MTPTNDLTPIRITELADYANDRRTWYYKWVLRLRAKDARRETAPLISGTAIHFGIEAALLRADPAIDPHSVSRAAAYLKLGAELGEGGEKYKPGVDRALSGVPERLFDLPLPQTEMELRIPRPDLGVEFVGRPDVWFRTEDGVEIYEFKTSSSDEAVKHERYEKWSMQARYLAVLLDWQFRLQGEPTPPIYISYIMLSTRGKHVIGRLKLVTRAQLDLYAEMLEGWAGEMRAAVLSGKLPLPTYSALMEWSEYKAIEEARLAALPGMTADDVIADDFEQRRGHDVPVEPRTETD